MGQHEQAYLFMQMHGGQGMWEKGGARQWSPERADMNGGVHEVGAWAMGWRMDASARQWHMDGTQGTSVGDVMVACNACNSQLSGVVYTIL